MAEPRWLGAAVDIVDTWTLTIGGTWAQNDILTLTINGKDLVLTVGASFATTDVATAVAEMINGEAFTVATMAASQTGNNVGEWSKLTATVSGSVVTLKGDTAGVPHLPTEVVTAGSGTAVFANSAVATGKHFYDNVDNWSTGAVPVDDTDTMVFDAGDVSVKYNLTTAIQPTGIKVLPTYGGDIGLPKVNKDNPQLPYNEYRGDYLTFADAAGLTTANIEGGGGIVKIDFGDCDGVTINVNSQVFRTDEAIPAILLKDDASSTNNILNVVRGDVGCAFYNGEAAHYATLNVSFFENLDTDANVVCGDGVDLTDSAIVQQGGTLTIDSTTSSGTIKVLGGKLSILSGAHADIEVDGGTLFYRSVGTITALEVGSGATVDFRRDLNARTVTACNVYAGATIHDPKKSVTWTADIDVVRANLVDDDVTLDVGTHIRVGIGAVA